MGDLILLGVVQDVATLGRRVESLRRARGLEQLELAERAGLSRAYISRLENGGVLNPKLYDLSAIAQALGTSVATLTFAPAGSPPDTSARDQLAAMLLDRLGPEDADRYADLVEQLAEESPETRAQVIDTLAALIEIGRSRRTRAARRVDTGADTS